MSYTQSRGVSTVVLTVLAEVVVTIVGKGLPHHEACLRVGVHHDLGLITCRQDHDTVNQLLACRKAFEFRASHASSEGHTAQHSPRRAANSGGFWAASSGCSPKH